MKCVCVAPLLMRGDPGQGNMAGRALVLRIEPRCASLAPVGLPSLTPPARLADPGLRAALAQRRVCAAGGVWAVLLFPSPYHGVLAVNDCACGHACGLAAVFDL